MDEIRILLGSLNLTAEEKGTVEVEPEETKSEDGAHDLLLVARVLVARSITPEVLERTAKRAWRIRTQITITPTDQTVKNNTFFVKFADQEDREWVLNNGPWNFDDRIIVLSELRRGEQVSELNLNRTLIWFHIMDLPINYCMKLLGYKLGSAVGEVIWVENEQNSLRVLAWIDISKSLRRMVQAAIEGSTRKMLPILYEKLSDICFKCECLDHIEKECRRLPMGERGGPKQYGTWLRYTHRRQGRREKTGEKSGPPVEEQECHIREKGENTGKLGEIHSKEGDELRSNNGQARPEYEENM